MADHSEERESASPGEVLPKADATAASQPTKTPMYKAIHSSRYERQGLIKRICEMSGASLICYVCGSETLIGRDDTVFLVDLLHNVRRNTPVDILLHTGGGDIDAAEKLINIIRTWVGPSRLRAVVPDYAKSAGTLMALGTDSIVMSDTSELGPIDPQVRMRDASGNFVWYSVQTYIDAYETHCALLRESPTDVPSRLMLEKLDPAVMKRMEAIRERSRQFAESQLKSGMSRFQAVNYTSIAAELLNTKKWVDHGQMIDWNAALQMGLNVTHVDPASEDWQDLWQLYCLQRLAIKDGEKLFESLHASLITAG